MQMPKVPSLGYDQCRCTNLLFTHNRKRFRKIKLNFLCPLVAENLSAIQWQTTTEIIKTIITRKKMTRLLYMYTTYGLVLFCFLSLSLSLSLSLTTNILIFKKYVQRRRFTIISYTNNVINNVRHSE